MTDYKALFYKSQAKIADLQEQLEDLASDLKIFMQSSEESVVESDDSKANKEKWNDKRAEFSALFLCKN